MKNLPREDLERLLLEEPETVEEWLLEELDRAKARLEKSRRKSEALDEALESFCRQHGIENPLSIESPYGPN